MSRVIASAAMSLDGYVSGPGESGFESAEVWQGFTGGLGALVVGRRLFDLTDGWKGRHPLGVPVVVLTHARPQEWVERHPDAPYEFVAGGIEAGVATARRHAGDSDVGLAAGIVAQQALDAGLVDELLVMLVPVLLGGGRPSFETLESAPILLEDPEVIPAVRVTHLRFRVRRGAGGATTVAHRDGVRLCIESIGEPGVPALLLIGGAGWSMDWWEDGFCRALADRGRRVIRYDQRDTGRSTHCPPGAPDYGGSDLVADALAVLDATGVERAHVVGLSMGGGVAQRLGLDHRDRVASLTLIATSPGEEGLPGMAPELEAVFAGGDPALDWEDRDAVIEHVVAGERPFAGPGEFDEARMRKLAARVVDRSGDVAASLTNHFLLEDDGAPIRPRLPELAGLPTLVVHGTADPLFPPAHGRALADEIPGARLIELDGVGHQLPPPRTWQRVVDALTAHTR